MHAVPGLSYQQEENMVASSNAGSEVPFAQLVFDSHVFGRKLTEAEQRDWVHSAAQRFAGLFKEVAPTDRALTIKVLRSRGVRGKEGEAPLPSGDVWGVELCLRPVEVLEGSH